jgi:hypothetical protein
MTQTKMNPIQRRPAGLTFLSVVNAVAAVITVLFWGMVWLRRLVPFPGGLESAADRANSAVTYGFMIGDILYSVPLLLLAWLGIRRLKAWGWMAAQMANALWVYSLTVILFRDAYTALSPGGLLFTPFALAAVWAIPYLWKHRKDFGIDG